MTVDDIFDTIIKTAMFNYGLKEYRAYICTSNIFPGTGDYEDDTEIRDDRIMDCYCVWFEDILNNGYINSGAGYYEVLSSAIESIEKSPGFIRWIY
ncbi:MAG: hypothetical protein J6L81_06825 [Clostridia bacterium]|nr:hypothetical protein [Clostridia bacterium]